jgi:putative glutamine amidotransferase
VDVDRDQVEFQLCLEAVKGRLPFLGICRGIQVINVAQGGTLYPHVPDQLRGDFHPPHDETKPRDSLAHEVQVKPGSRLAAILGRSNLRVNSMHHQGIARLAPGFTANAHAPDGLIEAIELDDHPFGLAVQWHPEWLTAYKPNRALFRAFVEAASQ